MRVPKRGTPSKRQRRCARDLGREGRDRVSPGPRLREPRTWGQEPPEASEKIRWPVGKSCLAIKRGKYFPSYWFVMREDEEAKEASPCSQGRKGQEQGGLREVYAC